MEANEQKLSSELIGLPSLHLQFTCLPGICYVRLFNQGLPVRTVIKPKSDFAERLIAAHAVLAQKVVILLSKQPSDIVEAMMRNLHYGLMPSEKAVDTACLRETKSAVWCTPFRISGIR